MFYKTLVISPSNYENYMFTKFCIKNHRNCCCFALPLSVVFSDGRVKDIGWKPWLAFVLWLPLVNLILCFKKGGDGENGYGIPAPRVSLVVRIIVFGAPILIPIILIICAIYIHGAI